MSGPRVVDAGPRHADAGRAVVTRAVGAIVMDVIYGRDVADRDDPYVAIAERGSNVFSHIVAPGKFLVELFPALARVPAWFPGAQFKRDAAEWKKDIDALRNVPYDAAVDAIVRCVLMATCR